MCEFCDMLEWHKMIDKEWNKNIQDNALKQSHEYTVAIVIRSWTKKKGKRNAARIVDYRRQGIGYKLKFCPECGKRLGVQNDTAGN